VTQCYSNLPVRPELLRAEVAQNPHRVRVGGPGTRRDSDPARELRAAWLLWLVGPGHQTMKAAAAVLAMKDKTAWNIYHGLTHPLTTPVRPPEDVWRGQA
jgi:hypothetical protein